MRRTSLALAVAALVVLAGCSGFGGSGDDGDAGAPTDDANGLLDVTPTAGDESGGDGGTDAGTRTDGSDRSDSGADTPESGESTPTPTAAPSPTPTPTATATPARGSEEWLEDGGVNATALFRAHVLTVRNESSYAWRSQRRQVALDSEREIVISFGVRASRAQQRANLTINRRETSENRTIRQTRTRYRTVADGSQTLYVRSVLMGNESYNVVENPSRNFSTFYEQASLGELLSLVQHFELTDDGTVERGGETFHRLTADEFRDGAGDAANVPQNVSDASLTMLVSQRGVIRGVEYEFRSTSNDVPFELSYRFELGRLGNTTVPEPGWLDDAEASTSAD